MAQTPITAHLHVAGATMEVRTMRGREAVSEPSRLEIVAQLPEGVSVSAAAAVKSSASITFDRDGTRRRIDGVVEEIMVLETVTARPDVHLVLVPKFSLCRYRTDMKVFRDMTVPDIIAEVLGETGVSFELRLSASYPVRPYTVQYRETDFHFVSRLVEEDGMFYFFVEGDTMVIGDSVGAYGDAGAVPFRPPAGMDRNEESIWSFGELSEAGVSQVSLRDWNIDKPSLPMDVSAAGPTAAGPEWYDYPGEYEVPGAGQRIADLIAESFACAADQVVGRSSAAPLAPGRTFGISGAPAGLDGAYVVTGIDHDYDRDRGSLAFDFQGIDASVAFRPSREHEEPVLAGPVTGFVTGPPGADIHCDELGRVKVHFHWDRLQPLDDGCSHWVPVIQDNTGHSVQIPRVGWEVLVHFLEGDPDRPVVLGRVYNAKDTFPVELPAKKTYTSLGSLSSPTRDGFNEIQLNDLADSERILVNAEKDQNIVIANDRTEHVMSNEVQIISRDEAVTIGNDQTIVAKSDVTAQVKVDQTVTIGGNNEQSIEDAHGVQVGGDHALTIGGRHMRRVGARCTASATNITETVGAAILEASVSANSFSASKGMAVIVGGAMIELAKEMKMESASYARAEVVGGVIFSKASEQHKVGVGDKRITTVGGLFKVDAQKQLSINGAANLSMNSLVQEHAAEGSVTFAVGDTSLTMKEGVIHVLSPTIAIQITGTNNLGAEESYQN